MKPEVVKKIIETENRILTGHEQLQRQLDSRLDQLKEETELRYQQRKEELQRQREEQREQSRKKVEEKAAAIIAAAEEDARRLDGLEESVLRQSIRDHLNFLLPGEEDDRQDVQG
jgi:hypothetical protein